MCDPGCLLFAPCFRAAYADSLLGLQTVCKALGHGLEHVQLYGIFVTLQIYDTKLYLVSNSHLLIPITEFPEDGFPKEADAWP